MDMYVSTKLANESAGLLPLLDGVYRCSTHDRVTRPIPIILISGRGICSPNSSGCFTATGGLYKSALAAKLMCEHTNPDGGWLLGRPVMPGRGVYLDAENDDAVIDDRLRRLGLQADNDRLELPHHRRRITRPSTTGGLLPDLIGELVTPNRATLLIIDSFASAWACEKTSSSWCRCSWMTSTVRGVGTTAPSC
jgi:hypothetical protein